MTVELLNGKIIQKPLTSHKFSNKFIFSFSFFLSLVWYN